MSARMPILCQHDVGEFCRQRINQWHHFVAARYRQATARAKVVLDVDNQKHIALAGRELVGQRAALSFCAKR